MQCIEHQTHRTEGLEFYQENNMLKINRHGTGKDVPRTIRLSQELDDRVSEFVFQQSGYNNFSAFARDAIVEKITGANLALAEQVSDLNITLQRIHGILLRINMRVKKLPQGRTRKLMILIEKVIKETGHVIKVANDV